VNPHFFYVKTMYVIVVILKAGNRKYIELTSTMIILYRLQTLFLTIVACCSRSHFKYLKLCRFNSQEPAILNMYDFVTLYWSLDLVYVRFNVGLLALQGQLTQTLWTCRSFLNICLFPECRPTREGIFLNANTMKLNN